MRCGSGPVKHTPGRLAGERGAELAQNRRRTGSGPSLVFPGSPTLCRWSRPEIDRLSAGRRLRSTGNKGLPQATTTALSKPVIPGGRQTPAQTATDARTALSPLTRWGRYPRQVAFQCQPKRKGIGGQSGYRQTVAERQYGASIRGRNPRQSANSLIRVGQVPRTSRL